MVPFITVIAVICGGDGGSAAAATVEKNTRVAGACFPSCLNQKVHMHSRPDFLCVKRGTIATL